MKSSNSWPASPYKGLSYYGPDDVPLFAGREGDVRQCAKLLGLSSTRIMILHGSTGCGKSSFLRAGLIPFLETGGFEFLREDNQSAVKALFVRSTDNPLAKLAEALFDFASQSYQVETLLGTETITLSEALLGHEDKTDFMKTVGTDAEQLVTVLLEVSKLWPKTLVLVIDQAEEVLTVNIGEEGDRHRKQFFEFMARFSRKKFDLKLLVALRTEFYGRFLDKTRQVAADTVNIRDYLLSELTEDQLVSAIVRPTLKDAVSSYGKPYEHYGFEYEPDVPGQPDSPETWGVARTIAHDLKLTALAGGELPVMQIACGNLYRITRQKAQDIGRSQWVIKKSDYRELGGIEGQMDGHLGRVLEELCRENGIQDMESFKEVEAWKEVLSRLVKTQVDGTVTTELSSAESLKSISQSIGCKIPFDTGAVYLSDAERRILRSVDVIDARTKETVHCYSLGHDVIGLVLKRWQATREVQSFKAARDAEERLNFWKKRAKASAQRAASGEKRSLRSYFASIFWKPIPITETIRLWRFADTPTRRILKRNLFGFLAQFLVFAIVLGGIFVAGSALYTRWIRRDAGQVKAIQESAPELLGLSTNNIRGQRAAGVWAKALIQVGKVDEALDVIGELKPLVPKEDSSEEALKITTSDIYADVALALYRAGKKSDAEDVWKRAVAMVESPDQYVRDYKDSRKVLNSLMRISLSYAEAGEYGKALEIIRKFPDNEYKAYRVATLALKMTKAGRNAEAENVWTEALDVSRKITESYGVYSLSYIIGQMAKAGSLDRALSLIRQNKNFKINFSTTRMNLVEALAVAGRYDEAKAFAEQPIPTFDIHAWCFAIMAHYASKEGKQELATKFWDKIREDLDRLKAMRETAARSGDNFDSSPSSISRIKSSLIKVAVRAAEGSQWALATAALEQALSLDNLSIGDMYLSKDTFDAYYQVIRLVAEYGDTATAYRFARRSEDTTVRGLALSELNKVLTRTGNINQALDVARSEDDYLVRFKALTAIAQTLINMGKSDDAKRILDEAALLTKQIGSFTEQSNAYAVVGRGLSCLHLYYDARLSGDPSIQPSDKLQVYAAIIKDYDNEKNHVGSNLRKMDCLEEDKFAWQADVVE
jgi:tetratricopeptide (TPR) repeat protein